MIVRVVMLTSPKKNPRKPYSVQPVKSKYCKYELLHIQRDNLTIVYNWRPTRRLLRHSTIIGRELQHFSSKYLHFYSNFTVMVIYQVTASSVGCACAWYADGRGFDPPVQQHSFMEIGHEIISIAVLPLPLIQVRQLSVTAERLYTKYTKLAQEKCGWVNWPSRHNHSYWLGR